MHQLRISVCGIVQGVGFRPFVYRLATQHRLSGWVQNTASGVDMEVCGNSDATREFVRTLRDRPPPNSRIDSVDVHTSTLKPVPTTRPEFTIRSSLPGHLPASALPPDIATCNDCVAEIHDSASRRYRYPFTSCSQCGPRYAITEALPFDRANTTMRQFELCDACRAEYLNPLDRRHHAQTIACPDCGPQLHLLGNDGHELEQGYAALTRASRVLAHGHIVSIKGPGGFQLCADAGHSAAIQRLRTHKQRADKPFALLCASLDQVRGLCEVSTRESGLLSSPAAPVVLLKKNCDHILAPNIAPANPYLGIMLASTPLQHLLLDLHGGPLVCTSGNLRSEPICTELDEARGKLGHAADLFLTHDLPIARPIDDSVVHDNCGCVQILRLSRGYSPLHLQRQASGPSVLALGAHNKNTVALATGDRLHLSQYIGSLDSADGIRNCEQSVRELLSFHDTRPDFVACDMHPDYASTRLATRFARAHHIPCIPVQHHQAHAYACIAEYGLKGAVLALVWDGGGYDGHGALSGSEALLCKPDRVERLAGLRPFRLAGGEQAIRHPARIALALAHEVYGATIPASLQNLFSEREQRLLTQILEKRVNCPLASGMGRLFDAIAVLAGIQDFASFDGHAAMAVEFAAGDRGGDIETGYTLPVDTGKPATIDWYPLVRQTISDRTHGVRRGLIAIRFHLALATVCLTLAERAAIKQIVLSGGCFQNRILSRLVTETLEQAGFQVYLAAKIPANDGGIALGQAAFVASAAQRGEI